MNKLIVYHTPSWLTAFTTGKGSGVEALGFQLEELALPRQVHSDNVLWMHEAGRPEAHVNCAGHTLGARGTRHSRVRMLSQDEIQLW